MLLRLVFIANIVKNILAKRSAIPSLALLVPYGNPLCGCFRGLQKYGHMLFADKRISSHSDQLRSKGYFASIFLQSKDLQKNLRVTPCFFASDKSLASLRRLACKRTLNGSDSLSTFHEIAREQGLQRNFLNKKVEQSCLCSLAGAGNGNRTRAPGLGSPYSTIAILNCLIKRLPQYGRAVKTSCKKAARNL